MAFKITLLNGELPEFATDICLIEVPQEARAHEGREGSIYIECAHIS